jgi:hypothetical protein
VPSEGIELSDGENVFYSAYRGRRRNYDNIDGTEYSVHTELTVPTITVSASVPSGQWTNGEVTFTLNGYAYSADYRL